jgi:hypothetical protein
MTDHTNTGPDGVDPEFEPTGLGVGGFGDDGLGTDLPGDDEPGSDGSSEEKTPADDGGRGPWSTTRRSTGVPSTEPIPRPQTGPNRRTTVLSAAGRPCPEFRQPRH